MSPTNTELKAAFNRSKLPQLGYTLQTALNCDALKTCLVRMVSNMQKQKHIPLPKRQAQPHWTDKY